MERAKPVRPDIRWIKDPGKHFQTIEDVESQMVPEDPPPLNQHLVQAKGQKWPWERVLRKVKAQPGTSWRIRIGTKQQCNYTAGSIRRRLRVVAAREKWTITVRKFHGDEGEYGLWVSYHGIMDDAEFAKEMIRRRRSHPKKAGKQEREAVAKIHSGVIRFPDR